MKYKILITVAIFSISQMVQANINNCSDRDGWANRLDCSLTALNNDEKDLHIENNRFIDECKKSSEKDTYTNHGNGSHSNASVIIDRMKSAQEAWLIWRNSKCNFEAAAYLNGSMEWDERRGCLREMTKLRTTEIKKNNFCRLK